MQCFAGESAEAIAERKFTAAWGMWLTEEASAEAASGGQTDEAETEDNIVNSQTEDASEEDVDSDDEMELLAADEMAVKPAAQPGEYHSYATSPLLQSTFCAATGVTSGGEFCI